MEKELMKCSPIAAIEYKIDGKEFLWVITQVFF